MNLSKLNLSDEVKNRISSSFDSGLFPHATLITGGTQKDRNALAMRIASAFVCTADKNKPCLKCPQCVKAKDKAHPDIIITEGSDKKHSINMDTVKSLRRQAYVLPNEANYEVFVILEASGMAEDAQNALLKILEEPPSYVRFILTAETKEAFLDTILSRVTNFHLSETDSFAAPVKESEKGLEAASDAAKAILDRNEYSLILSASKLVKDKNAQRTFFLRLQLILRDALVEPEYSASGDITAQRIAREFSRQKIMEMIETLSALCSDIDKNVNENLLLTRMSINISQSF